MIVKELIEYLQKQPQGLKVAYMCCSEQCLLQPEYIEIVDRCRPRDDGWIQNKRSDMPTETYLLLPGN